MEEELQQKRFIITLPNPVDFKTYYYEKPSNIIEIKLEDFIKNIPPRLRQKYRVFFRDRFRCMTCGSNKKLHLHHANHNHNDNNINNLMTLCSSCHHFYHTYGGF